MSICDVRFFRTQQIDFVDSATVFGFFNFITLAIYSDVCVRLSWFLSSIECTLNLITSVMSLQIRDGHNAVRVTSFTESSVDTEGPRVHGRDRPHHPQCDGRVSATQTGALASTVNQCHRRQTTVDQEEGLEDIQGQRGQGHSRPINVDQLRPRRETDRGTGTSFHYEGNVVSVRCATTFYIHFYHHDAIDTVHCGNERMTLNFLIAHQNLATITS